MNTIENMQDFGKKNQTSVDDFMFGQNMASITRDSSFNKMRKTVSVKPTNISRSLTISAGQKSSDNLSSKQIKK